MGIYVPFSKKVLSGIAKTERTEGRKIVLTGGCFDILHPGHLFLLEYSKSLGDVLVVNVLNDYRARKHRNDPRRPINSEEHRAIMIAAYQMVDYVTIDPIKNKSPLEHLAKILQPDIIVQKRDNEEKRRIFEKEFKYCKLELVEDTNEQIRDFSSTKMIEKIIRAFGTSISPYTLDKLKPL